MSNANDIMAALANALAPALAKQLGVAYKHTTPAGTPSSPYLHGPGGLFGVAGLERDVLSTRVRPYGIAGQLPVQQSVMMNPLFPYITGFLGVSGSNPTTVCSDGQVAGPMKNCLQTAQFGRYTKMTRELERNRLGQRIDRSEFFDLRLVNDPLLTELNAITPSSSRGGIDLNREILQRFIEVGVAFQNELGRQLYTGNPSNNAAGGGYREFPGADILIGTGKVDAITGTNCPSLDSDIKSFGYGLVNATNLNPDIVNVVTYLYRYVKHNADTMGFTDPNWAFTMRSDLFYELTAVWPCSYLTYRCAFRATDGSQVVNVSANDQIAMRDSMRQGKYLLIEGDQVPVILDGMIPEETEADAAQINGGQYASDIYLFCLSASGMPMTYWEMFNYGQAGGAMDMIGPDRGDFWTDGGRFLWHHKPPTNWCEQWIAKVEPRLILHAPQLCGRISDVRYEPLQHTRDAHPSDPYFVNGGVSTARQGPSYYSDWNLPQ
jgi:hypothetical protein